MCRSIQDGKLKYFAYKGDAKKPNKDFTFSQEVQPEDKIARVCMT